ncbi:Hypothetical predicted protein [Octopus vulgaris]|uniref:Uncharacterized protein n=1 Tax=Octopus vulgaris TaxID=6645 RepID=A0AA36BQS2_OCTVU|nr:Hypothetical predicted protein [Octopus vulgaris]
MLILLTFNVGYPAVKRRQWFGGGDRLGNGICSDDGNCGVGVGVGVGVGEGKDNITSHLLYDVDSHT